ncbi:hypothetical protein V8D89_009591 [Ganoderma adspersum]
MLLISSPTGIADKRWSRSFPALILVAMLLVPARGGNTTCVSKQLDWYTSVVGESPCMTYQRLRQICNNDYQTPNFSSVIPGDRCDDEVFQCCCNTIAFQLSMLCMVCQKDSQDAGGVGINAPINSYNVYRQDCTAAANHTWVTVKALPAVIQSAVFNEHIRLDNFLYEGWDDGSWFYVYTKENAELEHATNNNNTFTHCPSSPTTTLTTTGVSSTATLLSNGQGQPSGTNVPGGGRSKSKSHASLIGGPVAGGVVGLVMIVAAMIVIWKRRNSRGEGVQLICDDDVHFLPRNGPFETPPPASAPANFESLSPNRLRTEGDPANPAVSGGLERTPEISTNTSNPLRDSINRNEASHRHDDGGPLMPGLTRSNSGRLPPAYNDSWDSHRHGPRNAPGSGGQTTNGAAPFRGLSSIARTRALPVSKELPVN